MENRKIVSLLIVIIFLLVGLSAYLYFRECPKTKCKACEKCNECEVCENNNNDEKSNTITTSFRFTEAETSLTESGVYNATIKSDNSDVKLKYEVNDDAKKLTIADKVVYDRKDTCAGPISLYVLQDNIVVDYTLSCDIIPSYIEIYDTKGNAIKKIEQKLDNKETYLITVDDTVENNKIKYSGTRVVNADLRLPNDKEVDICSSIDYAKYGITESYPVFMKYEITYLGNNKYSNPVIKETTTLKQSISENCE